MNIMNMNDEHREHKKSTLTNEGKSKMMYRLVVALPNGSYGTLNRGLSLPAARTALKSLVQSKPARQILIRPDV